MILDTEVFLYLYACLCNVFHLIALYTLYGIYFLSFLWFLDIIRTTFFLDKISGQPPFYKVDNECLYPSTATSFFIRSSYTSVETLNWNRIPSKSPIMMSTWKDRFFNLRSFICTVDVQLGNLTCTKGVLSGEFYRILVLDDLRAFLTDSHFFDIVICLCPRIYFVSNIDFCIKRLSIHPFSNQDGGLSQLSYVPWANGTLCLISSFLAGKRKVSGACD